MEKKLKILVATDFSSQSDSALKVASAISSASNGEIELIHISSIIPVWNWPAEDEESKKKLREFQNKFLGPLEKDLDQQKIRCKVECPISVVFGDPYEELKAKIEKNGYDLFVLGHRGKSGPFYLGSLAQKMIASATIPTLVVKEDLNFTKIAGLVDPAALSKRLINTTEDFSSLFKAETLMLCAVSDLTGKALSHFPISINIQGFSNEEKKLIADNLINEIEKISNPKIVKDIKIEITQERIADALIKALNEHNIDLAVMMKHNKGFIEKFLIGSTTRKILEHFHGNLLILPE